MVKEREQETSQDVISDLINRARLAGTDPVRRENIEIQAEKLGLSPSLLIILEKMQRAAEEEEERRSQEKQNNASIAVSTRALSGNNFGVKPAEDEGFLAILTFTLKDVSEEVKTTFLKSREDFIDTLQACSAKENKALEKVVSGADLGVKDIQCMKSLIKDPIIVGKSKNVVDNARAVARDILTDPMTKEVQKYRDAHVDQQAKINIVNSDPVVLKAARVHGMGIREAAFELITKERKLRKTETREKEFNRKEWMEQEILSRAHSSGDEVLARKATPKFADLVKNRIINDSTDLPPRAPHK